MATPEEVIRDIEALLDSLSNPNTTTKGPTLAPANERAANLLLDQARFLAPVAATDGGQLKGSGRVELYDDRGVVIFGSSEVPYAAAVEYGFGESKRPWGGSNPKTRFMKKARQAEEERITDTYEEQVELIIRHFNNN